MSTPKPRPPAPVVAAAALIVVWFVGLFVLALATDPWKIFDLVSSAPLLAVAGVGLWLGTRWGWGFSVFFGVAYLVLGVVRFFGLAMRLGSLPVPAGVLLAFGVLLLVLVFLPSTRAYCRPPPAPVEPVELGTGARLVVARSATRKRDMFGAYWIQVDLRPAGRVRRGRTLIVELAPGPHDVRAVADWISSEPVHIDLAAGDEAHLEVEPSGDAFAFLDLFVRPGQSLKLQVADQSPHSPPNR